VLQGRVAGLRRQLAVLLLYTCLGVALCARLVFHARTHVVADNQPDEALVEWFLAWSAHAATHFYDLLVSPALNVPTGVNAMWNAGLLLPSVVLAPLTLLAGAHTTFVVLLVAGPVLSAFTAYLCLRRFCTGLAGPVVGGLLFGFSPALVHHVHGHPQISLAFLVPPLLLLVVEAVAGERPAWRVGLLAGALVAAQLLMGEEMLLFTAGVALLLLVHLAAMKPRLVRERARRLLLVAGVAAGTAAVLASYPLYRQFGGPLAQHGSPLTPDFFKADVANIYTATAGELLAGHGALETAARFQPGLPEKGAYLGVALLLVCAVTAVRRRREPAVLLAAVLLVELTVLSWGDTVLYKGSPLHHLHGPWGLVEQHSVFENALVARLPVFAALMAAVLLAAAVDAGWGAGTRERALAPARVALGVLCLIPLLPRPVPAVAAQPIPSFFTGAGVRSLPPHAAALVVPYPTPTITEPMRWQVAAHFRFLMPGGFFIGPDPSGRAFFTPNQGPTSALLNDIATKGQAAPLTTDARLAFRRDLARWRARTVLLGPHEHRDLLLAELTDLLGRPPDAEEGGVAVWREVA
jgi:hypothetical protein